MAQDLYEILGVSRTADKEEIRKKYKKLARRYHPDVNPGDKESERKFKEISAAYNVISDDEKRKLYDEFGDVALQAGFDAKRAREWKAAGASFGGGRGGGGFEGGGVGGEGYDWTEAAGGGSGPNFDDLFSDLFSGLRGGRRGAARRGPEPGEDIEASLEVDFLTSIKGGSTRVSLERPAKCRACDGTGAEGGKRTTCPDCKGSGHAPHRGRVKIDRPCPTCGGSGSVIAKACHVCGGSGQAIVRETVDVKVPPGVRDGQRLRLAGLGAPGDRGAPPGDLYVRIRVAPHPVYRREGEDLHVDVPITIGEALNGATISFPTPSGEASFKVPPSTQTGRRFRLRGLGVTVRGGGKGDLYARVLVQAPETTSPEARELASKLDPFYTTNVRKALTL